LTQEITAGQKWKFVHQITRSCLKTQALLLVMFFCKYTICAFSSQIPAQHKKV